MDWEGKIDVAQPTCTASAAVLAPGETVYSALILTSGLFVRQDYSAALWPTVDRSTFLSWWKHKVPQPDVQRRAFKLNAETLGQIFANLQDAHARPEECLRYVVALALVRARKWTFIEVVTDLHRPDQPAVLVVQERATSIIHRLPDPQLSLNEQQEVLANLLRITDTGTPSGERVPGVADGTPAQLNAADAPVADS